MCGEKIFLQEGRKLHGVREEGVLSYTESLIAGFIILGVDVSGKILRG